MAFTHTKKVEIGSFIKARIRIWSRISGSDQNDPDPTRFGSATLLSGMHTNSIMASNRMEKVGMQSGNDRFIKKFNNRSEVFDGQKSSYINILNS
jgi:hypothetical protein